ncbi:MAG: hypothetical protein ACOX52_17530 [Verrucomicrobiota bacterium]
MRGHEGQEPTRTGIDSDPDFDFDFDFDWTDRTDRIHCLEAMREGAAFSEGLATEGTEFTERFFLLPLTRQPLLQPGCVEMGKNARLCVLGDLCGRTFLTSGRPKGTMAKQDRNRYRKGA